MANGYLIPPLDGTLIRSVALVDRIIRDKTGPFEAVSLPGHLVQVVTAGKVIQQAGGMTEHFGAGDAIWYHENESIRGKILEAPYSLYTVNFEAPTLGPPALDQRVTKAGRCTVQHMVQLLDAWRDTDTTPTIRHLRVHALLLEVLLDVISERVAAHRSDAPTQLWWEIEAKLRADLSVPIDLKHIVRSSRRSQRSIIRACHLATGLPPMKRIKQVRLSYARGLVQLSELSMSQIAYRVGYERVQELSRDYRRHFGMTPTEDRKAGPDYQTRKTTND